MGDMQARPRQCMLQSNYPSPYSNGIETDARFPYQTWKLYQRFKDRLPGTNIYLEG